MYIPLTFLETKAKARLAVYQSNHKFVASLPRLTEPAHPFNHLLEVGLKICTLKSWETIIVMRMINDASVSFDPVLLLS